MYFLLRTGRVSLIYGNLSAGVRHIAKQYQLTPVDIIHSNFQVGSVAALLLKIFHRSRTAMRTAHITLEWGEGIIAGFLRIVFQNWLYPLSLDAEVGVSQAIVDQLGDHTAARLWHKPSYLIYNAIDPAIFKI